MGSKYKTEYVHIMPKIRIAFICRGNTCRSPLAEALFNGILDTNPHLKTEFEYAKSAGVATYTNKVSRQSLKIGSLYGLGNYLNSHQCTQVKEETFDDFVNILCMDNYNFEALEYYAGNSDDMKKVEYLRAYDPSCK